MIEGEILVMGQTKDQKSLHEVITIRTDPGSNITSLIMAGKEYGQVLCSRTVANLPEKATMIGEECDLLGMASPYTYIAKQRTLVFVTKVEKFYKEMLNLNPVGLEHIKQAAAQKLKELNSVARQKKDWDRTVSNIKSIK